jgi:hypothetical protein
MSVTSHTFDSATTRRHNGCYLHLPLISDAVPVLVVSVFSKESRNVIYGVVKHLEGE